MSKKAGIIRCQNYSKSCAGEKDYRCAAEGSESFEETGPVEIVSFEFCGGCPGNGAGEVAKHILNQGAEVLFLSTCLISQPCHNYKNLRQNIDTALNGKIPVIEGSH
jgi:predicted metal-binding protein